jgi:uncharacterized protein YfaP (DUF2135 family)
MRRPGPLARLLAPIILAGAVLAMLDATWAEEPAAPVVRITSPLGGWTAERLVTFAGTVEGEGVSRVTVNANGTVFTLPVAGGRFERRLVLAPGENGFRVTARNAGGRGSDGVVVHGRVEAKDVRVTLVWDTPGTDVDLWVTDPDGERCKYDHAQTKLGGTLDVDVTDGYGPEVFTLARAKSGAYAVVAHYYSGGAPTRARVEVVLFEGTAREERREAAAVLLRHGEQAAVLSFVVP